MEEDNNGSSGRCHHDDWLFQIVTEYLVASAVQAGEAALPQSFSLKTQAQGSYASKANRQQQYNTMFYCRRHGDPFASIRALLRSIRHYCRWWQLNDNGSANASSTMLPEATASLQLRGSVAVNFAPFNRESLLAEWIQLLGRIR